MKQRKRLKRGILSWLIAIAMIGGNLTGIVPGTGTTVLANRIVNYIECSWSGSAVAKTTKIPAEYTELADNMTAWTNGVTYIVPENGVTISNRITVSGTVNLILCDGATLTAGRGITVDAGNTLNIFSQSYGGDMGALLVNDVEAGCVGIGADYSFDGPRVQNGGKINIHGGRITVTGGENKMAIGDGIEGSTSEVTVYGGVVNAKGHDGRSDDGYGAGSGGTAIAARNISVYGGTLSATGGNGGNAAYDMGEGGSGGIGIYNANISVLGGVLNATGGTKGMGRYYNGGYGIFNEPYKANFNESTYETTFTPFDKRTITVRSGGTLNARGGTGGSGICYADVTVNGGGLTATGGVYNEQAAMGIGKGIVFDDELAEGVLEAGDRVSIQGSSDNTNWTTLQSPFSTRYRYMRAEIPHVHGTGADEITFAPWAYTDRLPMSAGNYYLTTDVTLTGTWTVPTGITNLCLNGYMVRLHEPTGDNFRSVIKVQGEATFNLWDEPFEAHGQKYRVLCYTDLCRRSAVVIAAGCSGHRYCEQPHLRRDGEASGECYRRSDRWYNVVRSWSECDYRAE